MAKRDMPVPRTCSLCSKAVQSWDEFFYCVADHCRVYPDDSSSGMLRVFLNQSREDRPWSPYLRSITKETTGINADHHALPFRKAARSKADLHSPQSADVNSTGKAAANVPSTPTNTTGLKYATLRDAEKRSILQRQRLKEMGEEKSLRHQELDQIHRQPEADVSIDPGTNQGDTLEFLLNPVEYYGKLEKLELDTAGICDIDRILSRSPDMTGPYFTLSECIEALSKCVDAFLNLQKEGFCERVFTILVEDPFRSDVAEAVHIPLEDLESIVASLSAPKTSEWEDRASAHVLQLLWKLQSRPKDENQNPNTVPHLAPHEWLSSLSFLCTTLSIGLVSFSGSHVCRFDINFRGEPVETIPVGCGLKFTLRKPACLDDFIGGPAWILGKHDPTPSPATGIKVSLAVQDFNQLWGPIWLLGGTPLQAPVIKTERGFIIPLSDQNQGEIQHSDLPYEVECHWTKQPPQTLTSNKLQQNPLLNNTTRILIGTTSDAGNFKFAVNDECRSQIDSIQQRIASQLEFPGACKAHYVRDGWTMNFGGGQHVTGGISRSWKRMPARTYKSAFIEYCTKPDAEVTPLLKLQIGLEISACTWNARRISLWDALCLSQTKRANEKASIAASPTSCEHSIADCISSCWDKENDFRGERVNAFGDGPIEQQVLSEYDAWRRITKSILALQHTGVDHKGSLQAWSPFTNTLQTYRMPPNEVNNWFCVVEDSPVTATFAVVSKRCLELREQGIARQCSTPRRNSHVKFAQTGLSTRIMLDPLLLSARNSKKKQRDDLPAKEETVGLVQGTKVAVGKAHLTVESGSKGNQRAVIASVSTNPVYRLGARLLAEGKILKAREQVNDEITTGASFPVIVY